MIFTIWFKIPLTNCAYDVHSLVVKFWKKMTCLLLSNTLTAFRGFNPLRRIAIIFGFIWNFSAFSAPALERPKLLEWPEFLKASLRKAPGPLELIPLNSGSWNQLQIMYFSKILIFYTFIFSLQFLSTFIFFSNKLFYPIKNEKAKISILKHGNFS